MQYRSLIAALFVLGFTGSMTAQELKPVQLPPPRKEIGKPLMQALAERHSTREFSDKPLPLQEFSNLLWAANGINRAESGKRTAPSAMNWQETDIYVILPEGAYIYDAKGSSLAPVIGGDFRGEAGTQPFVKDAPLNLVYVADYARMSRASDEDKNLYAGADAGFIAENAYLYCASQGFAVVVRGSVDRAKLSATLKLRPEQKIILTQTIGYPR